MEFSSSPSLDLVALVDPAARGPAPPLVSDRSGATATGVGPVFDLCLGQLLPGLPSGETLPPTGKELPVVAAADVGSDDELAAEALALALPAWLAMPVTGTAPPTATALGGSATSASALPTGSMLATTLDVGAQSPETPVAPSPAGATATAAEASAARSSSIPAAVAAQSSVANAVDAGVDGASAPLSAAAAKEGAAPVAAPVDAASVADDYAAAAANATVRGDSTNALRRSEDAVRGVRVAWRDARHASAAATSSAVPPGADSAPASTAPSAVATVSAAVPPVRGDLLPQGRGPSAEAAAPVADVAASPPGQGPWLAPGTPTAPGTSSASTPAAGASGQHTPVDTTQPRWQEAFASRVQWLADQNVGEAHLRLNPPDLGTVDVKISLVEDRTFVHLTTHTAAARDELAQSLPRLRELFASSGLELGGASVQNGRDGQTRYDGPPPERGYLGREPTAPSPDEGGARATATRRGAGLGRIDLFA